MEACFATMFEDVRLARSSILLLSKTDPGIIKQRKFTDHKYFKKFSFRKITQTTSFTRASGYCSTRIRIRIVFSVY